MNQQLMLLPRYGVFIAIILGVIAAQPSIALAGNGANFVLYNHHTAEAGELEVMFMNDFGEEPNGVRYNAQMIEAELGITDQWTTEFMIESFVSKGFNFTGFRWENRYRLFDYGTFLNPVIYFEYEDLSKDTKYLMEVSGREDASAQTKVRPRERVFESRLILGEDITDNLDISFNWLNESDLDTGITAFGYATGLNYSFSPGIKFGLELFGGLGDSNKGVTTNGSITQHYLAPNVQYHATEHIMVKFGGAIGLTNVSQDLFRFALVYKP